MQLAPFRALRTKLLDPRQTRLREAQSYGGSRDPDADHSDFAYYRQVGQGRRDWSEALRADGVNRAIKLLDVHPIINRYVTAMTEWTRPGAMHPRARDERVDKIVQRFWGDPTNRWPRLMTGLSWAKLATGELFLPVRVVPVTLDVLVDYWDPADVVEVLPVPGRSSEVDAVRYKMSNVGVTVSALPAIPVVRARGARLGEHVLLSGRPVREVGTAETDPMRGVAGVIAHRWNALPNGMRGRSDFLAAIDPLTMHRDFLDACTERAAFLSRLAGDVTVKGNQAAVDAARARYKHVPPFATMAFHNEDETWNAQVPSTNAADSREMERMIRVFACAVTGLPPHVLSGDFTEGNRAVAASAMDPAYLRGESKQAELAAVVREACQYAVDVVAAERPAELAGVEDWTIDVEVAPLIRRDPVESAPALQSLAATLASAVHDRLVDRGTAREMFLRATRDAGFDGVEVEEVEERLADEEAAGPVDAETRAKMARWVEELERGEQPEIKQSGGLSGITDVKVGFITGTTEIIEKAAARIIPRESALAQLRLLLNLSAEDAEALIGPAGTEAFVPATEVSSV